MARLRIILVDSLVVLLLAAGLAVWLDYATTWARTGVWAGPSAAALGYIAWRVLSRRPAN